ncbi:VOC family protein [Nonomuraea polychroma]|uniref:VOC family protein n=1 Tax=Nonomuraea polychroma TaxID=46176 RepID=UPI0019D493EC|nr:VOC family protein [Nonomuraea polychroma]
MGTAFLPVADPAAAALWYADTFGFETVSVNEWSANLAGGRPGATLTLMGPDSGIQAEPGLPFSTHNFNVDDVEATRRLAAAGLEPTPIEGDPDTCLYFTVRDPDGNILLICDR